MTTRTPANTVDIVLGTPIPLTGTGRRDLHTATGAPLEVGTMVAVLPQPNNAVDANALSVLADGVTQIGYIPRALAQRIASSDIAGHVLVGRVSELHRLPSEAYDIAVIRPRDGNVTLITAADAEFEVRYRKYNPDGTDRKMRQPVAAADVFIRDGRLVVGESPIVGCSIMLEFVGPEAALTA